MTQIKQMNTDLFSASQNNWMKKFIKDFPARAGRIEWIYFDKRPGVG